MAKSTVVAKTVGDALGHASSSKPAKFIYSTESWHQSSIDTKLEAPRLIERVSYGTAWAVNHAISTLSSILNFT